jgi:hypothetical protein
VYCEYRAISDLIVVAVEEVAKGYVTDVLELVA